ncbi:MAG: hypothetical protein MJ246_00640 [Clostridia bacterium]|nr:hypothetical protein [Clostridia bacterium]
MEKESNKCTGLNVSSLVLGIISIVTCAFWYVTIPTGVLAIVFGAKGAKSGSGLAKTGLILGIVGLSIFVLLYMLFISAIILSF